MLVHLAIVGGVFTYGLVSILVWFITMVWAAVRAGRDHTRFEIYIAHGARDWNQPR